MRNLLFNAHVLALAGGILVGCATTFDTPDSTYVPATSVDYDNHAIIPYDFDTTWDKVIDASSKTFFGIENFEKDSGLLTLSFGSNNIEEYIDCGTMNGTPYVTFRLNQQDPQVNLQGKINLFVKKTSASETRVTVNARYILSINSSGYMCTNPGTSIWGTPSCYGESIFITDNMSWSFDSRTYDTATTKNPTKGTSPARTCAATGELEKYVLSLIKES